MQQLMATTKTMQAAGTRQKVLGRTIQYGEMPVPNPGAGEVRVKIHASGVNPSDTKSRSGWGGIMIICACHSPQ